MRYQELLFLWLNHTSTATLLGLPPAGGQRHVAFGRSREQLEELFEGSGVPKDRNEWHVTVQPYGDIPSATIRVYENPGDLQRAGECRLAAQSLRSPGHYPLWKRVVIHIPRGSLPRQAILIVRDTRAHFHARVIGLDQLDRLPPDARRDMLTSRKGANHLVGRAGSLQDIECAPPSGGSRKETGVSGSSLGRGLARPRPRGSPEWKRLRELLSPAEQLAPVQRLSAYRRTLRRRSVRDLALRCFGARCQVRGCEFTESLASDLRRHVLVVHHLTELARGGTERPHNLAVVCANHHALCHYAPRASVEELEATDDVLIVFTGGSLLIERDLSALMGP